MNDGMPQVVLTIARSNFLEKNGMSPGVSKQDADREAINGMPNEFFSKLGNAGRVLQNIVTGFALMIDMKANYDFKSY